MVIRWLVGRYFVKLTHYPADIYGSSKDKFIFFIQQPFDLGKRRNLISYLVAYLISTHIFGSTLIISIGPPYSLAQRYYFLIFIFICIFM